MGERPRVAWVELLRRLSPLLLADLFDRLRAFPSPTDLSDDVERAFAANLQQAIAALDSLHHTLTTFLPRYLLDLAPTPGQPYGELLEGSFIFADVTGFTALTGELSRRGSEGREEMNRLMRALFTAILDPLLTSGGDLLIFAGDAALARFPARPDGQDARWAARTALRLVQAIAPFADLHTPYGDFSLTMSAGVERGRAFAVVVGTRRRMEFLVSGGPVQGAMQAEGKAEPGQVFAGPGVLPFLPPEEFILQDGIVAGVQTGELGDYEAVPPARRRQRISAIFSLRVPDLIEHLQQALEQVEALVPFVPPDILALIVRGEDIRQHPPVAVQFVNVLGFEELALGPAGAEQAAAILQRYFVQAHEVVADREGIISQVDAAARGFTLLNPFGAPTHHEGVPRLAVSAALELSRALEQVNQEFGLDPPLAQRIGLTYDRIFTGEIGSPHRREYVVAGPAVNLAARLMSKAEPAQIVLDAAIWNAVEEDFLADPLPPIPLKGIAEPVARFALRGLRRGKGLHLTDYPLVGFQEERAVLERRLDEAVAGRGGALALVGEAGAGKSRLTDALSETARRKGLAVLMGRCFPFAQTTPYLPWADLVSRWFELDEETPPEGRRQQLRERLARLDLASSLPAFTDLLGLPPAQVRKASDFSKKSEAYGADFFAALKRQAEHERADVRGLGALLAERAGQAETDRAVGAAPSLWEVLRERASLSQALPLLLERQTQQQPTLVVIEDAQWMDADSWEVLEAVAASAPGWPLCLLVATRPETVWAGERLGLPPLSDAEACALAATALRATRLQAELADWLLARAGGKPLFVLSYCRALRDADAVVVDADGVARWSGPPPALPISLQELLLAQVDQLGQETREVLQRAAVIGSAFPAWLLDRLCQDALLSTRLSVVLDQAARRSLVVPPPPAQNHTFATQSLHDAVYTALSHALRQAWHERVGDCLAEADEATRYERLEQIAHHYSRGDDPQRAARFTRLAGDKARARQADEAALAFYARTLAVADGVGVAAEQRLAREGAGDVYALQGDWPAARAAYQVAGEGAPPEDERRLRAKRMLLAPLDGLTDPQPLAEAWRTLPPSDPLRPWLGTAQVWLYAGRGETGASIAMCQRLLFVAGKTVGPLLQETLDNLQKGAPLPPYLDFFTLFARSQLRTDARL